MNVKSTIAVLIALLAICVHAAAQGNGQGAYCEDRDGFGDFDFWVGEWNVYSNDDERQLFGTNRITKHHGDCLLKEDWQGASGSSGFSVNYYNSVKKTWRQVWIANGYSIDYTGGLDADGAMVLEGSIYSYGPDTEQAFRGTWTPQDDGSVVQLFEIFDAENDRWNLWFEGLYVRAEGAD